MDVGDTKLELQGVRSTASVPLRLDAFSDLLKSDLAGNAFNGYVFAVVAIVLFSSVSWDCDSANHPLCKRRRGMGD